jgi:hypothetical protein
MEIRGREQVITKKDFLSVEKMPLFIAGGNARVYWLECSYFHKDSSKGKIVSILP